MRIAAESSQPTADSKRTGIVWAARRARAFYAEDTESTEVTEVTEGKKERAKGIFFFRLWTVDC
jgi:hypothetical protein